VWRNACSLSPPERVVEIIPTRGEPENRRTIAVLGAALNRDSIIHKIGGLTMNKDIFEGKWRQIRGEVKAWWGKLTDDDLDRIAGKYDVFIGLLQQKYGYTREQAAAEVDRRVTEYEAGLQEKIKPD
jgi:uncharacterized protein YjbJ (UPF0337 family)